MKPLEGEESATVWRQGDKLFHAVSVPMAFAGNLVGVLIAGYGINEALAGQIRKLTHSEIAFLVHAPGQAPLLSVSSLGPGRPPCGACSAGPSWRRRSRGDEALRAGPARASAIVAVQVPLKSAAGETVGSMVALRSLADEMASFRQFRNSLVLVSLRRDGRWHSASPTSRPPASPAPCARWSVWWSARATARTRGRSPSPPATRSARWPAPSTTCSPTCARRSR